MVRGDEVRRGGEVRRDGEVRGGEGRGGWPCERWRGEEGWRDKEGGGRGDKIGVWGRGEAMR